MDQSTLAALGGAILIVLLISLAISIVIIIATWKIFTKAGEAGWKCLIPYYNSYIMFKLFWNTNMFWAFLGLSLASGIFSRMGDFMSVIGLLCSLATLVFSIMLCYYMAKSFGKGAGFTVGLVLLPVIFIPILGFGSAQYLGNTTQQGGNVIQ